VVSDGTSLPYRFRVRSPDFVNLSVLPHLAQGAMLADVVALIGTIDIVLGSVDR
jgi:NADH:ubiquinone oxidoreductase subunit D